MRFLIEFIRINPRSFFGRMTNAQAASLVAMAAGVLLLVMFPARGSAVPEPVRESAARKGRMKAGGRAATR